MMRRITLFAAVALALTGCSDTSADDDAPAAVPSRTQPAAAPAPPPLRLPLTAEDIEGAALTGELACAFTQRGAQGALLVAMADVVDEARAEGVLKLGPSTLRLSAVETGGFNAMVHGARFSSGDLEARVLVTSDTPTGGGEARPLPARLEIGSPAGTQQIDGEWACGP